MARDKNAKAFAQQKRHRRQWLTFVRMCRYGINNFSRNAWLTIAATAVMTITLLIIFSTVVAQNVLSNTTTEIGKRIDRSIFLKTDTTLEQAQPIINDLRKLSNVDSVKFVSTEEGKQVFAQQKKTDAQTLEALSQATNQIPAKVSVNLKNVNDISQLVTFVKTNQNLKRYIDPDQEPTFMGERKAPTETIAGWTATAQKIGIIASIIFVSISMLIIFNTIRMAIFNRRDEIEMMKLIGANKSFIRGPFLVEAIVYGLVAAVIATILGYLALYAIKGQTWVSIAPTYDLFVTYIGIVALGMIVVGSLIGMVSAFLATQKYLKI